MGDAYLKQVTGQISNKRWRVLRNRAGTHERGLQRRRGRAGNFWHFPKNGWQLLLVGQPEKEGRMFQTKLRRMEALGACMWWHVREGGRGRAGYCPWTSLRLCKKQGKAGSGRMAWSDFGFKHLTLAFVRKVDGNGTRTRVGAVTEVGVTENGDLGWGDGSESDLLDADRLTNNNNCLYFTEYIIWARHVCKHLTYLIFPRTLWSR